MDDDFRPGDVVVVVSCPPQGMFRPGDACALHSVEGALGRYWLDENGDRDTHESSRYGFAHQIRRPTDAELAAYWLDRGDRGV